MIHTKKLGLIIVGPIIVMRIPGIRFIIMRIPKMRKGGDYHIAVHPLLRELTILNTNTITFPSLGRVYTAL